MVDICIIGAGPAGLTAAIYGLRAGRTVLNLEALSYGGQIINTTEIENYPGISRISGFDFATELYNQALSLGMRLCFDRAIGIRAEDGHYIVEGNIDSYEARTIIAASGVKRRHLEVPGEERLTGMGVSYCATCDGAFYKGRKAAVCGGGNTALEEALFLSEYCSKVYLVHRRDTFRGERNMVELLRKKENVCFVMDAAVSSVEGDDAVSALCYTDNKSGAKKTLQVDGVFIAVGQIPDTDFLKGVAKLDESGYVSADESCVTSAEGIFAAGDCRCKEVRQLTTAAADGTIAALAACRYLERNP